MDGSPAIFLLVAGHRVRGVTFQRGCVGKRVHLGSRTSVSHQRGAACHRPLDVRLSGARFHPDGTRSMRQPAGSAVRAGQSSRPTVRSRRAKKRPSRRTTSQRERRSPASRRGSSTSPGPRSHVLPPAQQSRRGLPRPNRRAAEGSARRGPGRPRAATGCLCIAGFLPTVCEANTARRQRCRPRRIS